MTDFDRIFDAARRAEASQITTATLNSANAAALKATKVQYARERFAAVGVADYLRTQADAMQARGFWIRLSINTVEGRAQASLEFVPAPGEAYRDDHVTGRNTAWMVIESYGEAVYCRLGAREASDNGFPTVPLEQFELTHVKAWFERLVHFGLDQRKPRGHSGVR